jgi:integrase
MLRVRDGRASWVFRFTSPAGRRREMGLGVAVRNNLAEAGKTLTAARDGAEKARLLLREQVDPIEHARIQREDAKRRLEAEKLAQRAERQTLARCCRAYHERVIEPVRSTKHAADWINSLEQHVPAALWHAPIADIKAPDFLDFFVRIRRSHRETGRRVVQRLCKVYSDAVFRGLATANVAAAAAERLRELGIRREVISYAALPFAEVPAFMARLREQPGIAARALEFAVLTAARTGEVIGAQWGEFDLDAGLWTVPASRMKGGEAHTVYLSTRAVEIVRAAEEYGGESHVFPSPTDKRAALSNMAMLTLLRRMDADKRTTVHGLCRASFSTWANETGAARGEVIEACLAHRETDRVRAAYNRAKFAIERRALLNGWADYCAGKVPASNVIELAHHRAAG